MVGLIAMLGLSVDGGGILFLYRDVLGTPLVLPIPAHHRADRVAVTASRAPTPRS